MEDFTYIFRPIDKCDMCGAPQAEHAMLGMRLNKSQGRRPRNVSGVAVAVKRCKRCGLIFADPQPIPQSISDHYDLNPNTYFDESQRTNDLSYFAEEIATAKHLVGFKPGMKALDVGVGLGKGMKALSNAGFDVWGVEPSNSFLKCASQSLGLDPSRIINDTIEAADLQAEQFDFIVFGAVLEHLHSPGRALSIALKWLKPGGVVHAEVPSSDYLMSKFANLYFALNGTTYVTHLSPMHPPFHLYEFTRDAFRRNGERQGYELACHNYKTGPVYHLPRFAHWPLQKLMEHTQTGMQLTVFLKKSKNDGSSKARNS